MKRRNYRQPTDAHTPTKLYSSLSRQSSPTVMAELETLLESVCKRQCSCTSPLHGDTNSCCPESPSPCSNPAGAGSSVLCQGDRLAVPWRAWTPHCCEPLAHVCRKLFGGIQCFWRCRTRSKTHPMESPWARQCFNFLDLFLPCSTSITFPIQLLPAEWCQSFHSPFSIFC